MSAVKCTRVEQWIFGYYVVKYDTEKEPVNKPLLGMRYCPEYSVIDVQRDGFTFHWCAVHAAESKV